MSLAVECVRVHSVTLPLREPFETSVERETERPLLVVEALAGELAGYGEVSVSNTPYYYPDTAPTARLVLRDFLAPLVLARPFESRDELPDRLAPVRGWNLAKAGLEAAVLDLWARLEGVPLWRAFGGVRPAVECGTSIGLRATIEETLACVDEAVASGARRAKLKIGPGRHRELLASARERHPEFALAADANEAFGPGDLDVLAGLDDIELRFLEQPFPGDALLLSAELARRARTPVCLDDGLDTVERVRLAHELGALRALNVKAPRLGSWVRSAQLAAWCRERGVPAFVGGLLDTGIGKTAALSLATCAGFVWPADATPSAHHFERDLVDPPVAMTDGIWRAPERSGLGVEVDVARLSSDATLEIRPE